MLRTYIYTALSFYRTIACCWPVINYDTGTLYLAFVHMVHRLTLAGYCLPVVGVEREWTRSFLFRRWRPGLNRTFVSAGRGLAQRGQGGRDFTSERLSKKLCRHRQSVRRNGALCANVRALVCVGVRGLQPGFLRFQGYEKAHGNTTWCVVVEAVRERALRRKLGRWRVVPPLPFGRCALENGALAPLPTQIYAIFFK